MSHYLSPQACSSTLLLARGGGRDNVREVSVTKAKPYSNETVTEVIKKSEKGEQVKGRYLAWGWTTMECSLAYRFNSQANGEIKRTR